MNGIVIGVSILSGAVVIGAILTTFASTLLGLVVISEREVGIVVKKFAAKPLPAGRLVALNGEAGYQADSLIGDITPPAALMLTQTDRKIAEEQRKTVEVQQAAQTQRQKLVRETAMADIQSHMVKAEQGVNIDELRANSQIKQATGEAESIRRLAEPRRQTLEQPHLYHSQNNRPGRGGRHCRTGWQGPQIHRNPGRPHRAGHLCRVVCPRAIRDRSFDEHEASGLRLPLDHTQGGIGSGSYRCCRGR